MLKTDRPIAFLDIESTGVDKQVDRIVELAVVKLTPNMEEGFVMTEKSILLNPEMLIPQSATDIHGISNEDVKDCPTFRQISKSLNEFLNGCDLGGFNSNLFDVPMLNNEFQRAGIKFEYGERRFVDVGNIFKIQNPRTLSAAVEKYLNREHKDAHGALADIKATVEVLFKQLESHEDVPKDIDELALYCNYGKPILDLSGKFSTDVEGNVIFTFGPNFGKKVEDYPDFLRWMLTKDFPSDTMDLAYKLLNR